MESIIWIRLKSVTFEFIFFIKFPKIAQKKKRAKQKEILEKFRFLKEIYDKKLNLKSDA